MSVSKKAHIYLNVFQRHNVNQLNVNIRNKFFNKKLNKIPKKSFKMDDEEECPLDSSKT